MNIDIDTSSAEPVYEQIVRQVQQGVRSGALPPGFALPSIRQLANDLDLNNNTVAKAYRVLESERVIRTAGQKGTFINTDALTHIHSRNSQDAVYQMGELAMALTQRGLSLADVRAAFEAALAPLVNKENP